jgi:hypothetical protein
MASYTIMNALGAGVTSSKFFQTGDGARAVSDPSDSRGFPDAGPI